MGETAEQPHSPLLFHPSRTCSPMQPENFYRDRSQKYAPKTAEEVMRAAADLAASGYTDHTIASVLKLDVSTIRQMLGQRGAVSTTA